jgi:hypothetical protein
MLILASTSDILRIVTSAAATVDIHATWADNAAGTVTPGRTNTEVTTATTTTVVGSPAASTQRTVQLLTVRNVHASVVTDVTIQHFDGTTSIDMHKTTLGPGESVVYVDGSGFIRLNSAGSPVGAASLNGADVQVFTANGTWTKPTGFTPKVVIVEAIGAGGGGGGGGSLATAVVCKGGGGGGGGAWIRGVFAHRRHDSAECRLGRLPARRPHPQRGIGCRALAGGLHRPRRNRGDLDDHRP